MPMQQSASGCRDTLMVRLFRVRMISRHREDASSHFGDREQGHAAAQPETLHSPTSGWRRPVPGRQRQAAGHGEATCHRLNEQTRNAMLGNPRALITGAERRFPVRIRIAVPPEGLGRQHARMTAWLDENCGADGWAMTPSGTRGVLTKRCGLDLLPRCSARRCVRCALVHRLQGRDRRRDVQGARG